MRTTAECRCEVAEAELGIVSAGTETESAIKNSRTDSMAKLRKSSHSHLLPFQMLSCPNAPIGCATCSLMTSSFATSRFPLSRFPSHYSPVLTRDTFLLVGKPEVTILLVLTSELPVIRPGSEFFRRFVLHESFSDTFAVALHHRLAVLGAIPCRDVEARCGWITLTPAEITLDGLDLFTPKSEVLYIPKRSAIFGPAKIFDKRLIVPGDHALQIKALDPVRLRPAFCFESTLVDVVVIVRAGKREAVAKQIVNRAPLLLLPS